MFLYMYDMCVLLCKYATHEVVIGGDLNEDPSGTRERGSSLVTFMKEAEMVYDNLGPTFVH